MRQIGRAVLLGTLLATSFAAVPADAAPVRTVQLVGDPGFEHADVAPCVRPVARASTTRTARALVGRRSLAVRLQSRGSVRCRVAVPVAAKGAVTVLSTSLVLDADHPVQVCVVAVGTNARRSSLCHSVRAGRRTAQVALHFNPTTGASLRTVAVELSAGARPVRLRLDATRLRVTHLVAPDDGAGAGGGGSGGGDPTRCSPASQPRPNGPPVADSPCNENELPDNPDYVPATLHLADQRPYLPLTDYTIRPASSAIATAFLAYVDRAVAGHPDYGYSDIDAVTAYARTHQDKYLTAAIKSQDAVVKAAEAAIAKGKAPAVAGDDYLEIGETLESLAFTYDWGYAKLTASQRSRWKAFGDQALSNLWSPQLATWGTAKTGRFAWNAWSINNPGNNYNFSFILATQTWAIATQETAWFDFLQTYKFPRIEQYYAGITGGGSREGTGYGTAQGRLWANERLWREATGERLPAVEAHARASIDFWVNATVPTLDYFAPIGDLSRESVPSIYDYQTYLVREAAMEAPDTVQAGHALWWIANNVQHDQMASTFNDRDALLLPTGTAQAPTDLTYEAPGVGEYFTRSSWAADATWLDATAGPYDESHAHQDQGNFTLYRGSWQVVTPNIWSHSGLQGNGDTTGDLGSAAASILRFDTAAGKVPQNNGTAVVTTSSTGSTYAVHEDLAPVYSNNAGQVSAWTRDLSLDGNVLTVDDTCTVGSGVKPVWQLQLPVKPTVNALAGTATAGSMHIDFGSGYAAKVVDIAAGNTDFSKGWRLELTRPTCAFHVELTAGP